MTGVFSFCDDTCAIMVTHYMVAAQNLQPEELFWTEEFMTTANGKTADMSKDTKFFVLCGQSGLLILDTSTADVVSAR